MEYVRSDGVIGLPKTPAQWIGEPKYEPVSLIGISGRTTYMVVERISMDRLAFNQFITVKEVDTGDEFIINTKYIIRMSNDYNAVYRQYYNNNTNFKTGATDTWHLIKNGCVAEYVDVYGG